MAAALTLFVLVTSCATGSNSPATSGPVLVGILAPLTGTLASFGPYLVDGIQVGVYAVNQGGGILGQSLVSQIGDTQTDPVNAAAAFRALLTRQPSFVMGPTSLDIQGVAGLFEQNHVVDFFLGGATQWDTMGTKYKYLWRTAPSDGLASKAEALYATKHGCTRAAGFFENDASALGKEVTVTAAFKALGGTIVADEKLTYPATSYLSEVQDAFKANPQCLLVGLTDNTFGVLFSNMAQLGDINLPIIGDGTLVSTDAGKVMGYTLASKYLFGAYSATYTSAAYDTYAADFKKILPPGDLQKAFLGANMYDAVVICALAMTKANSTDPKVWVNDISGITGNEQGQEVSDYKSAVDLIKAGKAIDYEGAGGSEDFDKNHNVSSDFVVGGYTPSGGPTVVEKISAGDVAAVPS